MDVSPIIVDIETAPLVNVRDFIEPLDLSDIQAPSNYVKQEAIDGYVAREKEKRLADLERDVTAKAALDFNLARIVALGWWTSNGDDQTYEICQNEEQERTAIQRFWTFAQNRMIVGFSIREFDLPMLIQRSRYLGVAHRTPDLGRYSKGAGILDLRDLLTFNDMRYEAIMPRSVKAFCRRFGIPVNDPISGAEIPALVAAGEWEKVAAHVTSDVGLEVAMARRLGVLQPEPVLAAVVA